MAGFLLSSKAHARFCPYLAVSTFYAMASLMLPQTAHALAPAISAQPVSQAVLPGSNATFIVTAASPPLAYQWRFNGGNVSGATNSALTITNVQTASTGTYTVVITNASGVVTSSPATLALATAPDFLWARNVTNGASPSYPGYSYADHVAADHLGNVFVAGMFFGGSPASIDFGGSGLTNIGGARAGYFICKYDRSGNFAWARQVATNSADTPRLRLATDSTGNVYFVGRFTDSAIFGTHTLVSSGSIALFLAKYNSQGEALWVRQINAYDPNLIAALALAIGSNANVFISAAYTNNVDVGGMVISNSASFLAKYDSAGNLAWAKPAVAAEALAVGLTGSIYTTGGTRYSPTPFAGTIAKYDSVGNLVWSRLFPHGRCIVVDAAENIYATGMGIGTFDDITMTNANGADFVIARYDSAGQLKWFHQAGSTNQPFGMGMGLDAFGNIYATASTGTGRRDPVLTFGSSTLTNTYSFLVKYDPAGNALWAVAPGGTNNAPPFCLTLVNHEEIYLAGKFKSQAPFGNFNLFDSNPMSYSDFYLA